MFETHPDGKSDASFKGSVVVYTGESPEAVRSIIENDVYATSGVWDLEKAQIIPVRLTLSMHLWECANGMDSMFPQYGSRYPPEVRSSNGCFTGLNLSAVEASGLAYTHFIINQTKRKENFNYKLILLAVIIPHEWIGSRTSRGAAQGS